MTAEDLVAAAEDAVAEQWRQRLVGHIAESINQELRAGLPMAAPQSDQQALSILRGVAHQLRTAGLALYTAAEALKRAGRAHQASQAHEAAHVALDAAEDVIGE